MEDINKTIALEDENGNKIDFDVITKLDIENEQYVIVIPSIRESDDEEEAIALKIQKNMNDEDVFVTVDDEEEFNRVCEAYEILFSNDELN